MEPLTIIILVVIGILILLGFFFCLENKCFTEDVEGGQDRDPGQSLANFHYEKETGGASKKLLNLQNTLRDKSDEELEVMIVEAQRLLLSVRFDSRGEIILTREEIECNLIIGVDATPAHQAGFCVNLKTKSLHYYTIRRADFPFTLKEEKDPSEFEMKNLMFALLLWEGVILKMKTFRIYTDNYSITPEHRNDNEYGKNAFNLLTHLTKCKGTYLHNWESLSVNKYKNLKGFAKHIKAADDLSRWKINLALDFLQKYYGIQKENVKGTHVQSFSKRGMKPGQKVWYDKTEYYREVINTVRNRIRNHKCQKASCKNIFSTGVKD